MRVLTVDQSGGMAGRTCYDVMVLGCTLTPPAIHQASQRERGEGEKDDDGWSVFYFSLGYFITRRVFLLNVRILYSV